MGLCGDLWTFFSFGIQDSGWNLGSKLLFLPVFLRSPQCADTPHIVGKWGGDLDLVEKWGALACPVGALPFLYLKSFLIHCPGLPANFLGSCRPQTLRSQGHLSPRVGEDRSLVLFSLG